MVSVELAHTIFDLIDFLSHGSTFLVFFLIEF